VLHDFYSNYYRKIYGNLPPSELFDWQKSDRGKDLFAFVSSIISPKKVLEVGCGSGGLLAVFKENNCDVVGLDFDDNYLQIARDNGIKVHNGSIEVLGNEEKFDVIILSHVLEHIVDPLPFLESLVKHLSKDGVLYIEVPSLNNVASGGYSYDLLRYWQNAHTIHFSNLSLRLLCKRVGLRCVKSTDFIKSCWILTEDGRDLTKQEITNCFDSTSKLLEQIERNRTSVKAYAHYAKRKLRRVIVLLLTVLGLRSTAEAIYLKVRKRRN
jgi:SAM-dependent methyltransferase